MTTYNLEQLLAPQSVAVIGAGDGPDPIGEAVLRNLMAGGFKGAIWPVGLNGPAGDGLLRHARVADLPGAPDLAVVTAPAGAVPGLIRDLVARGCRCAVVTSGETDPACRAAVLEAARPKRMRLIGPNSIGLIVPPVGLDASLARVMPEAGRIALLSQSGTIASTVVDWATARGIGFSAVMSLGEMAEVDVADCLDLLAGDGRTRAVLLYLQSIPNARRFLSAARAIARLKPVIAIKAGRSQEGAVAAATHAGALSGSDEVADAALRRAGVLRVYGLSEMFDAAETVARFRPLNRARLGIVTNGGGAGVLAVDRLDDVDGMLAGLTPDTTSTLEALLPGRSSVGNPVSIGADASPERYIAAIDAVTADPGVDVVLAINSPSALADQVVTARAIAEHVGPPRLGAKPVLCCWLGGEEARAAREVLHETGMASYEAPAEAAGAVGHLTNWGRAQAAMMRVPDRDAEDAAAAVPANAREKVAAILAPVMAEGRARLTEVEAKAVIAAYGVPVVELRPAANPAEVGRIASMMLAEHRRLVVKLLSRDITHKSDVGGVVLDIETAAQAEAAAEGIAARVAAMRPGARLDGFTLHPMLRQPGGAELILGIAHDPAFGPVIVFGAGGTAVEVLGDTAVGLPPLDAGLADDLVAATRVGRLLTGYRERPPADMGAVHGALIALSRLIEDFPCLRELDINPLMADAAGVVALDAAISIDPADRRAAPNPDLAIRPYPSVWRREVTLRDGVYEIRPIRPADAFLYVDFLAGLTAEHVRMRFLAARRNFTMDDAVRLAQLDYDREMAFIALSPDGSLAGVSRLVSDRDAVSAEYALIVRSDRQGRGIGTALMTQLIEYARASRLTRLTGHVLADNYGMLDLVQGLGFIVSPTLDEPGVVMTELTLAPQAA